MVYRHKTNGKGMVLWKIVSWSGDRHGNKLKKKIQYERYNANQISFMNYMKWTKVMLSAVFWGVGNVLYFFAPSLFSLSLSIGKRSTLAKNPVQKILSKTNYPCNPSCLQRNVLNISDLIINGHHLVKKHQIYCLEKLNRKKLYNMQLILNVEKPTAQIYFEK